MTLNLSFSSSGPDTQPGSLEGKVESRHNEQREFLITNRRPHHRSHCWKPDFLSFHLNTHHHLFFPSRFHLLDNFLIFQAFSSGIAIISAPRFDELYD